MDLKIQQAQALMQTQARTEVTQSDDTFKFTLISNIETIFPATLATS